jgi:hypothetical protein
MRTRYPNESGYVSTTAGRHGPAPQDVIILHEKIAFVDTLPQLALHERSALCRLYRPHDLNPKHPGFLRTLV